MNESSEKLLNPPLSAAIRWQCRRGMLELDLLLLNFYDKQYEQLDDDLKKHFIELLAMSDQDLFEALIKRQSHLEPHLQKMVERILQLH